MTFPFWINVGVMTTFYNCMSNIEEEVLLQEISDCFLKTCISSIRCVCLQISELDTALKIKTFVDKWIQTNSINLVFLWGATNFNFKKKVPNSLNFSYVSEDIADILELHSLTEQPFLLLEKTIFVKLPLGVQHKKFLKMQVPVIISVVQSLQGNDSGIDENLQYKQPKRTKFEENFGSTVCFVKAAERPRESQYQMISVREALDIILRESITLKIEVKRFQDSFSYIAAENIVATEPYPQFRASIKDGYAVMAEDMSEEREVIGVVTPGSKLDFNLKPGLCVRISTGSAVPDTANAVIQVEDTAVSEKDIEGNEVKIKILKKIQLNQDIRAVGSDVSQGQVLIPVHTRITAAEMGVMATCGIDSLSVFQKPCVALLSTGDEVMEPGVSLRPGCIRDSNKSSILYMLKENKISAVDCGIAKDDPDDVKAHLVFAFETSDIVITTGGVSMGEKDILKQLLETDFGATILFGRIMMKPGKPATFSTVQYKGQKKLIFSLPGNPVSAFVCFYLFVIPCIKKLMGYHEPQHESLKVQLAQDLKLDQRPEFYRVFLRPSESGVMLAHTTGGQQSSRLLSMQKADALLVLPAKTSKKCILKKGENVDAILLKIM